MNRFLSLSSISLSVALSMPAKVAQTDWSVVDTILTRTGAVSGDVHRYGLPRSDLNVSLDGVALNRASPSAAGSPSSRWATRP